MPSAHRRSRTVSLAVGLACALGLVVGCANGTPAAPQTVTVTAPAATVPSGTAPSAVGGAGGQPTGATTPTAAGAPITVVAPSAAEAHSGAATGTAATSPAAGNPSGTSPFDPFATTGSTAATTATTATSATVTSLTATGPEATAAAHDLSIGCPVLLSRSDLAKALGRSLADKELRVVDVANPASRMTARTKCYYGTDDIAAARPVVLALASYVDSDAADEQLHVTVDSERSAGAKGSALEAGGHQTSILIRDGGLAIAQVGSVTVSIAIAKGVIADSALPGALIVLMRAVVARLT